MSDANDENLIDFSLKEERRRMLFYKRPLGTSIPVGVKWRCVCGAVNVLNDKVDQYCADCGSRLRNQEGDNPKNDYDTCVIVSHFRLNRKR